MNPHPPIIGITMGDPTGIGPEIILKAFLNPELFQICHPIIIGDLNVLRHAQKTIPVPYELKEVALPFPPRPQNNCLNILSVSQLDPTHVRGGLPTPETGHAMVDYIFKAIEMAIKNDIQAIATCPINKHAMHMAGFKQFAGHTEILATKTNTLDYVMMLAGDKLRVALVTIHIPFKNIVENLTVKKIIKTISITHHDLQNRFGIKSPRIAVAALNPHAGENGLFGNEEKTIIEPAIQQAIKLGYPAQGPFSADSLFYFAVQKKFDVVICMYHDQGLIPFKMIQFNDGVNTTLGLPIIRTSVDHGTAYDIVGTGHSNPSSLVAAIKLAVNQALHTI